MSGININAGNLEVMLQSALGRIKSMGHEELGISKANFDLVVKILLQMISMVSDGIQEYEIVDLKFKAQELSSLLKDTQFLSVIKKLSQIIAKLEKAIIQMIEDVSEEFGPQLLKEMQFTQMALNNLPKIPSVEVHFQQRFRPVYDFLKTRPPIPESEQIALKMLEALESLMLSLMGIDRVLTDDVMAGNAVGSEFISNDEFSRLNKKQKKTKEMLEGLDLEKGFLA